MHKLFIVATIALSVFLVAPDSSYALSCLDQESSVKYFIEDAGTVIVKATPKETKEHVKEKATKDDPNRMYDSGFSAQLITVADVYKGSTPDSRWVYFQRDETWNYLCSGGPVALGEESIYVLSKGGDLFGVTSVAAVYPADSVIAKNIITAAKKARDAAEYTETPEVFKTDKMYWLTQLRDELKDMAFLVKVKLSEWTFWNGVT